jgi:rod shape-determining protein MreD
MQTYGSTFIMSLEKHHSGWVILVSFMASFMLAVIPLPAWASVWRPDWVAMVLTYWCLAVPGRVGVATGWLTGMIHDVLSDTLLGQHALSFGLIAYLSVRWHRQVRLFPLWQQALCVFGVIAASQLINRWINDISGNYIQEEWSFIYPAISSMLLWPWLFIILRDLRRTHHVF